MFSISYKGVLYLNFKLYMINHTSTIMHSTYSKQLHLQTAHFLLTNFPENINLIIVLKLHKLLKNITKSVKLLLQLKTNGIGIKS